MNKSELDLQKINLVWPILIVVFGTILAWIINGVLLSSYGYPINTFLFRPEDRFMDFVNFWKQCQNLNPYLSVYPTPTRPYFPFAYFFNHIFIFSSIFLSHIFFFGIATVGIFYFGVRVSGIFQKIKSNHLAVATLILFSYPFLFVLDRGNPEIMILPFLLCFIYNYIAGNRVLALISIGFCISMKLTPALFVLLYLKDKKYKDLTYLIIFTFLISFLSLYFFSYLNPGTSVMDHLERMLLNQKLFTDLYGKTAEGMYFSHSLFGAIKYFIFWGQGETTSPYINLMMPAYTMFTFLAALFIGLWIILKNPSYQITISLIVAMMLLFPHMSADYKLLNILIIGFIWFWDVTFAGPWLNLIKLTTALILVPKAYFFHHPLIEANLGVIMNPGLLVLLIYLLIRFHYELGIKNKTAI